VIPFVESNPSGCPSPSPPPQNNTLLTL